MPTSAFDTSFDFYLVDAIESFAANEPGTAFRVPLVNGPVNFLHTRIEGNQRVVTFEVIQTDLRQHRQGRDW